MKRPGGQGSRRARAKGGQAWIGISGYDYKPWRGVFYPDGLPAREWLRFASRTFNSIELNGTFYSLKSPAVFERWLAEAPETNFLFAVKGGRFITHNLKLRRSETALGNFFASGVLALGERTGPFLWQLPATYRFEADRLLRRATLGRLVVTTAGGEHADEHTGGERAGHDQRDHLVAADPAVAGRCARCRRRSAGTAARWTTRRSGRRSTRWRPRRRAHVRP